MISKRVKGEGRGGQQQWLERPDDDGTTCPCMSLMGITGHTDRLIHFDVLNEVTDKISTLSLSLSLLFLLLLLFVLH